MPYRIAGIDVHKKMLAVVVADVEVDSDYQFEHQKVGTSPADLHAPRRPQEGLSGWRTVGEAPRRPGADLELRARRRAAALADAAPRLRATREQLCDAFHACPTLHPIYRRLLKLTLEALRVIEDHLGQLDQQMADPLAAHHDAVQRLAEIPGLGVDSAQQIIAEVGATAATFPSPK
jgi:hypothetical protein